MAKRSNRMERRDNYTLAQREEEEALRASMSGTQAKGDAAAAPKNKPIAPRWERAQREKASKKKSKQ